MDLRSLGRAIRKYWWIVVLVTALSAVAAVWTTSRIAKTYASHVTFFVQTETGGITNQAQADQSALLKVNSYVGLLKADSLTHRLVGQNGVGGLTASQIAKKISASSEQNTALVTATVTDTVPARAQAISRAIGRAFPDLVQSLTIASAKSTKVTVVDGPSRAIQVGPHKALDVGLGILIGLAVGLGLAFLRELTDTSMRSAESVEAVAGVPVIGSVLFDKAARRSPLIAEGAGGHSIRGEELRQIRTNLQFADVDNPVRVIVVTSSTALEGKSTTATNLAIVFAESGQRVLLIEADMRRPKVADYLGLERAVGLSNVLAGQVAIDEVLQSWGTDGLHVLASGSIPPNPSELLGSQNMRDLMRGLRQRFDTIVIDTPPILPVTDAAVAAAIADGVVVIVRYGKTTRAQLSTAVKSLHSVDARVLGAVVNMRKTVVRQRYDGYGNSEDGPASMSSLPEIPEDDAATPEEENADDEAVERVSPR